MAIQVIKGAIFLKDPKVARFQDDATVEEVVHVVVCIQAHDALVKANEESTAYLLKTYPWSGERDKAVVRGDACSGR